LLLLVSLSQAQQIDLAVGGSAIVSSSYNSSSQAFLPPAEKGGMYPSVSAGVLLTGRFGFNAEIAVRAKQGLYNGYQGYRPVFYDVNAVFAPRISDNARAELMAGVGGESVIFYSRFATCDPIYSAGCPTHLSSTHFMGHVGGGLRYYFWGHFFVRPEGHLYLINNNRDFSSGKIGRLGVSIGYTFGAK
jgi:hypothetical protein